MIRKAEMQDLPILAELACRLWPDNTADEMCSEMGEILAKPDAAFFLAYAEKVPIGFAQCQLRHDYVEGTDSSTPLRSAQNDMVVDGGGYVLMHKVPSTTLSF